MDWGMKNRLSRILRPDSGRTVMLAIDHGYFQGPTSGLERPGETVKELLPHADCLMIARGALRNCISPDLNLPVVMRASGGTSVLTDLDNEGRCVAIDDAIRMNVSGLALSIFVGAPKERQTLLAFSELCDEGERYGIPILAVTAVGRDMVRDARYLGLASRIAAELGAHIVKTYYCEGFEKVVHGCPVPIVIAGGKKIPERDALQMAYNAINDGARGVDMGRNIFQSDCPVGMIRAVRSIVHDNNSVDQAFKLYELIKKEE